MYRGPAWAWHWAIAAVTDSAVPLRRVLTGSRLPARTWLRPHFPPRLLQGDHRVDVDHFAAQAADARQDAADVAADVQPHLRPHCVQAGDQPPLEGEHELLVDRRADQRRRGVAHADQLRPGVDLRPGELQLHRHGEAEQIADEGRIVEEVGHQAVDAPQVGGFGAGAFDPALDQFLAADPLVQHRDGLHAVEHAAGGQRIGHSSRASTLLSASRAWASSTAGGWSSKYWTAAPQSAASRAGSETHETWSKSNFSAVRICPSASTR